MLMCIQNLVKFCPLVLKILSGNEILTSIKGRNPVANLRNLSVYNPNLDTINVNVYHNSVANLQKMTLYNTNLDLVNANVYTNFG